MSPAVDRRGALIPLVLIVMVIIALAACAALFAARQDRRASWSSRLQVSALAAADRAHAATLREIATIAPTLAPGGSVTRVLRVDDGVHATVHLTRLGPTLFSLAADGGAQSLQGLHARRRTALILRLDPPALGFPAALSIVGATPPDADASDGADRAPSGWLCDAQNDDTAATRHPSVAPDSTVIAALRDRAAIVLPPGTTLRGVQPIVHEGVCATSRSDNWGDPDRVGPCAAWLPVIHAMGDLTVEGGAGQGLLVVDGHLMIAGGFRFVGAVIVAGTLGIGSGGARVTGGVSADRLHDGSGSEGAAPFVHRSTCAIESALIAAGALVPVAERPWVSVR